MSLSHWEDFWRTGRLVSCPTDAAGGYSGSVRTAWEQFFAALPDGAHLLDVGTGNGVLPVIALESARRSNVRLEVHGVDLAQIDPRRVVPDGARRFAGVVFHGGVAAEAMPFANGYFHAASGQYALEYTRRDAALREIRRVMAANAPALFILHHAASVVVSTARESLLHARELEEGATAFTDLREFVAAERTDKLRAAQLRVRIEERIQYLRGLAAESKGSRLLSDVLPALGKLFDLRQRVSAVEFTKAFDATYRSFKAAEQRLHDLVDVALDEAAMAVLAEEARASGFADVRFSPVWQDAEFLVGWRLDMRAASAPEETVAAR